jgi:hypothetical protein
LKSPLRREADVGDRGDKLGNADDRHLGFQYSQVHFPPARSLKDLLQ